MKYKYGTEIFNAAGEKIAELQQIVIDPKTDQVTALVAQKGFLLIKDKIIPISLVRDASEDRIELYDFKGSFDDLEDFMEVKFVQAEDDRDNTLQINQNDSQAPLIAYPPALTAGFGFAPFIVNPGQTIAERQKNIPADQVNIQKGQKVNGLDGEHVGDVKEVLVDPDSDQITHFVLSKGILFHEEKMIPAAWVRSYDNNHLKLFVDSEIVEQLPEYSG